MMRNILPQTICVCAAACVMAFVTGCETTSESSTQSSSSSAMTQPSATPAPAATPAAPTPAATPAPVASAPAATSSIIRIDAGAYEPFTDSSSNVWQADKGFDGGDVIERDSSLAIANTKDAGLFHTEHYSMDSFTLDVPNGKYLAKLYFAETYEGISGPGDRVFSFNVQGHDFKDFDVWVKAGEQTAPTSNPCRWTSPTGNSKSPSRPTLKIRKSTRLN